MHLVCRVLVLLRLEVIKGGWVEKSICGFNAVHAQEIVIYCACASVDFRRDMLPLSRDELFPIGWMRCPVFMAIASDIARLAQREK